MLWNLGALGPARRRQGFWQINWLAAGLVQLRLRQTAALPFSFLRHAGLAFRG